MSCKVSVWPGSASAQFRAFGAAPVPGKHLQPVSCHYDQRLAAEIYMPPDAASRLGQL